MKTPVLHLGHPLFKPVQIVDALGLDEFGAGLDLLSHSNHPVKERIGKGVGHHPHKKVRGPGQGFARRSPGPHPSSVARFG